MTQFIDLEKRIDDILAKVAGGAFEEDVAEVRTWKESVKRAFLVSDIQNHAGIKLIIERFIGELENINFVLMHASSAKIPDKERDRLLDKKSLYEEFISLFPGADQEIEAISKVVTENEDHLGLRDTPK